MGVLNRLNSHLRKRKINKKGLGCYIDFLSYIDNNSTLEGCNRITGKSSIYNSQIGKYTYAVGASIGNAVVGKFCSIAMGAKIGGLGAHPTSLISTHPIFYSSRKQCGLSFTNEDHFIEENSTVLGNDVWVGANAIIMDGVKVGDGAIIAAGAVVTKNVKPYSIVAGVPAIVKRFRCSTEQIQILERIAWWNWPEQTLKDYSYIFQGELKDNISELIKINEKLKGCD
ncbi:CatB-related O-acetyltransferase [Citrobacter freundii]|jgi:acetyltransferase-like isoleucine patch superfamily enzyme|uniref:CatB-related O-acetyltransferase n=1 Tax=Citrobacter freundii TaxID=546 RepID=UPI001093E1EE|nr:CatB-related O-acetyltransferase [Citrobacter freundii]QCA17941.1 CatB-related O-acetyltransferase [Citrobacter freundii]QLS05639.1 CatB-related O-acetyltransferase [Citrobacter freundii]